MPGDDHVDRIAIHNRRFQSYHQILTATKAEREAIKLEQRGDVLVRKGVEDDGLTCLEKAIWIRSNFAVLNGGHLPGAGARGPINEPACLPGGITGSFSTEGVANPHGTMWEQAEAVVVLANQITVRTVRTLGTNYAYLVAEMMNLCQRLLWTPAVLLARDPEGPQPSPSVAPAILAAGPIVGSDPFAGFPALQRYLLGASLNNFGAFQLLQKAPLHDVIVTFERCLRLEDGTMSCRTLFNLSAVLVQAEDFDYALEAASRCVELANHYLSLPFIQRERDTLPHRVFLAEIAVSAALAHHLISAVALWSGVEHVAIHQAQLAMGCSQVYLGPAHALTTRCADRLDSLLRGDLSAENESNAAPPVIPLQMATFATGVRPSTVVTYALAYPLSPSLRDFFDTIGGQSKKLIMGPTSPSRRPAGVMRITAKSSAGGSPKSAARSAMSQFRNAHAGGDPSSPMRGPLISSAAVAKAPTSSSYLELTRKAAAKRALQPDAKSIDTFFQEVSLPVGPLFEFPNTPHTDNSRPFLLTNQGSPRGARNSVAADGKGPLQPHPPPVPTTLLAAPRRPSAFMIEVSASPSPRRGSQLLGGVAPAPPSTAPSNVSGRRRSSLGFSERRGLRTPPRIGDPTSAPTLSVIPLRDFELYNTLKDDVNNYLAVQPVAQADGLVSSTTARSRQLAPLPQRGMIATSGKVERQALQWMTSADVELRRMSTVLPDHTTDHEGMWHANARVLQGFHLILQAKRYVEQLKLAALEQEGRRLALETIVTALRNLVACKPARMVRKTLQANRAEQKRFATIQAFARCHMSVAETGHRLLGSFKEALARKKNSRMQNLASVLIQSSWRGHQARKRVARRISATRQIQQWWRLYLAYQQIRILVFQQRNIRREENLFINNTASRLQRWAIHMLLRIRAENMLSQRKLRLEQHMENYRVKDIEYWNLFRNVDENECIRLICRVGRGAMSRFKANRDRITFIRETKAAKQIQHWVRFVIASRIMEKRRQAKLDTFRNKKLHEERKVAAVDIQSVARMFLQKRRFQDLLQQDSIRRVAAAKIQSYFRRARHRRVFRELQQQGEWNKLLYLRAAIRKDAATRIQALFRQVRAKEEVAQVRHFKSTLLPLFATRIQRAARRYLAKCSLGSNLTYKELARRPAMLRELQLAGAIKIQSVWRMHLVAADPRIGRLAHPTFCAARAAKRIQAVWRAAIAKNVVCQMRLNRAFCDQSSMDQEHLHAYATKIQSVVRARVLSRRLIDEARLQKRFRAVLIIQRMCSRYFAWRDRHQRAEAAARSAWEALQTMRQEEAAMEVQNLLRTDAAKQAFIAKVQAGIKIVRWAKVVLAKKTLSQLKTAQSAKQAAQINLEREKAAVDIQRAYRGHLQRRS